MVFRFIGGVTFLTMMYDPAKIWFRETYKPSPDLKIKYGIGSYALVTGATDGIGKAFCEALAQKGINIILVSRNQKRLDRVATEIAEKHGVKTVTHSIDLSKATESDFAALKQKTAGLDVSMLINNAGEVSYKLTKELNYSDIERITQLNSVSVLHLIDMYLADLHQRRPRSAVINHSSFLAVRPVPYMSVYSATKAFNHYLTEGLSEEYRETIDFLSFQPATIITKAVPNESPSWFTASAEESVNRALSDLGARRTSHGAYNHEFMAWVLRWTPEAIRIRVLARVIPKVIEKRTGNKVEINSS